MGEGPQNMGAGKILTGGGAGLGSEPAPPSEVSSEQAKESFGTAKRANPLDRGAD